MKTENDEEITKEGYEYRYCGFVLFHIMRVNIDYFERIKFVFLNNNKYYTCVNKILYSTVQVIHKSKFSKL